MATEGDCYEAAGNYLMQHKDNKKLRLIHGEVTGQGPLEGVKYGHAWIEDGNTVIDQSNGKDLRISKQAYYRMGRIGTNLHKYTYQQFAHKAVTTEIWGPWDLETESGL